MSGSPSVRERIGTELELQDLRLGAFAALDVEGGPRGIGRPQGSPLPGGARAVERSLTLAPVETREMSARERRPDDALAIDVHAARRIAGERRLEHFGERGLRRIRSRIQADDVARVSQYRAPDRTVDRARGEPVETGHDALVLLRVDRIVRPDVIVTLAVAVGVQNERSPALCLLLIAGFLEHLSIEPPEDLVRRTARTRPQRVVGILGKVQMMRAETGVDERELPGFRIVHGELAVGAFDGKDLCRGVIRPLPAEGRIRGPAHARGEPDPALLRDHRLVEARLADADAL